MSNADIRRERRYGIAAPVTFWWPGSDGSVQSADGITLDISGRGVLVMASDCPPAGALVQMTVILRRSDGSGRGMTLNAEGVVLRVEGGDRESGTGERSKAFAASVQFYPEARSTADQTEEILSEAAGTPRVN